MADTTDTTAGGVAGDDAREISGKAGGKRAGKSAGARPGTGPGGPSKDRTRPDKSTGSPAKDGPVTRGGGGDAARTAAASGPPGAPADGVSRRRLLGTAGAAGAAALIVGGVAGATGAEAVRGKPTPLSDVGSGVAPFHGTHQSGIIQPAQAHGHLIAFDLTAGTDRKGAAALMRRWSSAAAEMMAGRAPQGDDLGIALDAGPSSLTVTFGFGRTFFDRVGLTDRRPDALEPLPVFTADAIDSKRSNGDLWVQIGADDALVAFHALRLLQKEAAGSARVRWQMTGFNRTPGATAQPMTGRNLMGQIDGTNNPKPSSSDFARKIFVPDDQQGVDSWMTGGSYAVVRRIRMLLDSWDNLSVDRQERVIGRRKADGAPLSGGTETTRVDLEKMGTDGALAIPGDAHIRVAAPANNRGAAMLRRAFSYHDGFLDDGAPDAGLLFIAWQADPLKGFVPVQRKLDRGDGLSRFLRHEASALFAVPGGCEEGGYVGQHLLEG
ncbi:iron uptake transporter deferrochelatase/peroxidase subunit [Streptomyces sp. UNOB3_S3]|uniref:iron uptake transporter deferrochelatase/peroxidase subunit n=1 Tax=Streptomyces sp. UNOB3_S3 TaxID=2871682 RepID=UPI001E57EAA2|nr:iron uptake transporter deferrochelatase/peroxidase subunit [Streptomyces sp. UNOB3_S3]MCC3775490.1 deferrochelatase/peroxidase EfeB [Streptomyces sp. UNOB3_S3]